MKLFLFLFLLSLQAYSLTIASPLTPQDDFYHDNTDQETAAVEISTLSCQQEESSPPLMMMHCDCCTKEETRVRASSDDPNIERRESLRENDTIAAEGMMRANAGPLSLCENDNICDDLRPYEEPLSQQQVVAYCRSCQNWYQETNPLSHNEQILCEEDLKNHSWKPSHHIILTDSVFQQYPSSHTAIKNYPTTPLDAPLQFMVYCDDCHTYSYHPDLPASECTQVLCKQNKTSQAWEKVSFEELFYSVPSTHVLYQRTKSDSSVYYDRSETARFQQNENLHRLTFTNSSPSIDPSRLFLSLLDHTHAMISSLFFSNSEDISLKNHFSSSQAADETTPLLLHLREKKPPNYSSLFP